MSRQPQRKKKLAESPIHRSIAPVAEPLSLKDSMSSGGNKLCRVYTNVLLANTRGATKGEDAEYVHRMRVAVRKLRFILRLWNPFIDNKITSRLREEINWLAGALGEVRDIDILAQRFKTQFEGSLFSKPFKDFVLQKLSQKGSAAKDTLVAAITSDRYERLLSSFAHLFDPKAFRGKDPPLRNVVSDLFGFSIKKAGRYAGRKLDYKELHSLRIDFKLLRYVTEFFGDFYRGKLKGHLRQFKKFQDILGNFCDARVAESFLYTLVTHDSLCAPEVRQRCLELGGLVFIQRLDAAKQYRRFGKKAATLPERLELLRHQTKQLWPR